MKYCIFIMSIAMVACTGSSTFTSVEKEIVVKETTEMLYDYYKDIKTSGLTAEFKYLDHSTDFFWAAPGYATALSYDSIEKIIRHNATLYRVVENTFDSLHIVPLSKELASYTALITVSMTDTSGKTSKYGLIESGVLIKRNDGWKLLNGQTAVRN
ncbi:MAG: hypothetical protein QM737_22445 [Ferruginibacter sp.]